MIEVSGSLVQPSPINMDSPIGKQLAIILEHVSALESISVALKDRTTAYCIPMQLAEYATSLKEIGEPQVTSPLEELLAAIARRIEVAGSDIDATIRGLQI